MASSKYAEYELHELLNEVCDKGYAVIYISKLWRLLGKGNRAVGTWRSLLDEWTDAREGNKRKGLHISELPGEYILLTKEKTEPVYSWAQET
jgi:hypothetical protein